MISEAKRMKTQHKILKENHEILKKDYEQLQVWMKDSEETYDIFMWLRQKEAKELKLENIRLFEELRKERMEKDKYKKMLKETKTKESETSDELKKKDKEILLTKRKLMKLEDEYVELAEKLGVAEAELANKGSLSPLISRTGEIEVNKNVNSNNNATTVEGNVGEHDKPVRESNNIAIQEPRRNQGHRNTVSEETVVPKIYVVVDDSSSSSSASSTDPSLVFHQM